jgi:hypothetical protein
MTDQLDQIFLKNPSQRLGTADIHCHHKNPIKRAGFFSSDKTVYPFTVTSVPSQSGYQPWW